MIENECRRGYREPMVLAIIVVVVKIAILKLLGGWDCPHGGRRRGLFPQPLPGACAIWKDTGVHKKKESSYPY